MTEIVIASYTEKLDWIKEIPKGYKRTIYRATDGLDAPRKDKIDGLEMTRIPNGGREAGQYLWHIIHTKAIADVTLFVQGDFLKHGKISDLALVKDCREMAYLGVLEQNDRPWPFPLADMHLRLHSAAWGENPPRSGMFSVGAQFWATRKLIRSVPKSIYRKYYAMRNEPHFAHLLEGTWHCVFGVYR